MYIHTYLYKESFSLSTEKLIRVAYFCFGRTFIAFYKVLNILSTAVTFSIVCELISFTLYLLTKSSIAGENKMDVSEWECM